MLSDAAYNKIIEYITSHEKDVCVCERGVCVLRGRFVCVLCDAVHETIDYIPSHK